MRTLSLLPPWCFSRRKGYKPAPGFTFSLPFIIIPHSTTQLHYTNTHTVTLISTSSSTLYRYSLAHVMWSVQTVRESKIDHINAIYLPSAEPEAHNSAVGWHWNTHTHTHTHTHTQKHSNTNTHTHTYKTHTHTLALSLSISLSFSLYLSRITEALFLSLGFLRKCRNKTKKLQ